MVGDAQQARTFSAALLQAGIFAQAIAFPTVPHGTARLRLMLSATHTRQDLDFALHTFARVGRACQIIA
jgi:glycine C-acetyltransferase